MAKVSNDPLQPNPFVTYRDPETGTWVVVTNQSLLEKVSNSINCQWSVGANSRSPVQVSVIKNN